MSAIELYDYQAEAVDRMHNGCILCGDVGSGKSRTALAYYYSCYGGIPGYAPVTYMKNPQDLYIITTARKRDTKEWELEMAPFLLHPDPKRNHYKNKVVIDSWNNIDKYRDISGAFFLFDEQRAVGKGKWANTFMRIAKANKWIMLSATPGDKWIDYVPVFIANGFFRNRTDFERRHVVWNPYVKFKDVHHYVDEGELYKLRDSLLVDMDFTRKTVSHHTDIFVGYDVGAYKTASRTRWDPYKNEPIQNAGAMCYVWRRILNSSNSRQTALLELVEEHPKSIIFYNFDYELEILKKLLENTGMDISEWNGHRHEPIPDSDAWAYLVQYTAGCEGWNCTSTDTMIFYSQNYSYKAMIQAAGRINRVNTPYKDLYFYHLKTKAGIDIAIDRALKQKKTFNESRYIKWK